MEKYISYKEFYERIKYFENIRRLTIFSIEQIIGSDKIKTFIYLLKQQEMTSEQKEEFNKIIDVVEKKEIFRLLDKLKLIEFKIDCLENHIWVDIQEDYLPTKKQIEEDIKKLEDEKYM